MGGIADRLATRARRKWDYLSGSLADRESRRRSEGLQRRSHERWVAWFVTFALLHRFTLTILDDEMRACLAAGSHPNIIDTIGRIQDHPSFRQALVLQLVPVEFRILGGSPSLQSCSRDCFPESAKFSISTIYRVLVCMASAAAHLHSAGISHGDLYAHNTLYTDAGRAMLGDFGAATIYGADHDDKHEIEKLEVRAYGHLIEDLVDHIEPQGRDCICTERLRKLHIDCTQSTPAKRPRFVSIQEQLSSIFEGVTWHDHSCQTN